MTENRNNAMMWMIGIVVALCCVCAIAIPLGGDLYFTLADPPFLTNEPFFPLDAGTPTPPPEVTRPPVNSISSETLELLETTIVPPNKPKELACRLEGKCNIPDV